LVMKAAIFIRVDTPSSTEKADDDRGGASSNQAQLGGAAGLDAAGAVISCTCPNQHPRPRADRQRVRPRVQDISQ
jgi:hypothetical protein